MAVNKKIEVTAACQRALFSTRYTMTFQKLHTRYTVFAIHQYTLYDFNGI